MKLTRQRLRREILSLLKEEKSSYDYKFSDLDPSAQLNFNDDGTVTVGFQPPGHPDVGKKGTVDPGTIPDDQIPSYFKKKTKLVGGVPAPKLPKPMKESSIRRIVRETLKDHLYEARSTSGRMSSFGKKRTKKQDADDESAPKYGSPYDRELMTESAIELLEELFEAQNKVGYCAQLESDKIRAIEAKALRLDGDDLKRAARYALAFGSQKSGKADYYTECFSQNFGPSTNLGSAASKITDLKAEI